MPTDPLPWKLEAQSEDGGPWELVHEFATYFRAWSYQTALTGYLRTRVRNPYLTADTRPACVPEPRYTFPRNVRPKEVLRG